MEPKQHLGSAALSRYQTEDGASAYSGKFERSPSRRRTSRREYAILESFLNQVALPEASLLNMACGAGRFVELLRPAQRSKVVYADFSPQMLEESRARLAGGDCDHVEFRQLDATRDDAIPGFDLVFCVRMLHHMKTIELQNHCLDFLCGSSDNWLVFTCASKSTFKGWWRQFRTNLGLRKQGECLLAMNDLTGRLRSRGFEVISRKFVDRVFSSQTWILARRPAAER